MSLTKVKADRHGLYVRTNGSIYRPVPAKYSSPHPLAVDPKNPYGRGPLKTKLEEGDSVRVSVVPQSIFCRVICGHEEWWHSHGTYVGYDSVKQKSCTLKSYQVWDPK